MIRDGVPPLPWTTLDGNGARVSADTKQGDAGRAHGSGPESVRTICNNQTLENGALARRVMLRARHATAPVRELE
jgi:hypothetical protein